MMENNKLICKDKKIKNIKKLDKLFWESEVRIF
jgi:hypothetical protein